MQLLSTELKLDNSMEVICFLDEATVGVSDIGKVYTKLRVVGYQGLESTFTYFGNVLNLDESCLLKVTFNYFVSLTDNRISKVEKYIDDGSVLSKIIPNRTDAEVTKLAANLSSLYKIMEYKFDETLEDKENSICPFLGYYKGLSIEILMAMYNEYKSFNDLSRAKLLWRTTSLFLYHLHKVKSSGKCDLISILKSLPDTKEGNLVSDMMVSVSKNVTPDYYESMIILDFINGIKNRKRLKMQYQASRKDITEKVTLSGDSYKLTPIN